MKVFQTVISVKGFHEFTANTDKERLLERLAQHAAYEKCDVLLLPAGYWVVRTGSDLAGQVKTARLVARRHRIAIVGGIDCTPSERAAPAQINITKKQVGKNVRTHFGFAVDGLGRIYGEQGQWPQLSGSNADALQARPIDAPGRMLLVGDSRFGIVLCGEMHNPAIRIAIAGEKPTAILISGHKGLGQGLIPTLKAFHRIAGVAIIHSQHLKGLETKLHMVDRRGIQRSVSVESNLKEFAPIWAAAVVREPGGRGQLSRET